LTADELDFKDPSTNRLISRRSQWAAVPSVLFKGDYPTILRFDRENCNSQDQASRLRPALDRSGYRLSTSCSRGGGGQEGGQDTATSQPRPRREETWNAVVQSLPHRNFGTNSQRKGRKIALRLADGDRRVRFSCGGANAPWTRHTHHTRLLSRHPLGLIPRPRSRRLPLRCRSGLDAWWEEMDRAECRKRKKRADSLLVRITSRLVYQVAVYAVVVLFRDAGGIMWPWPGGVRRTRGRPPMAGTRFSVPSLWSINNRLCSIATTSGLPPQWSLVDEDDGFLSLPRPLLPVVAMRERSVPPPPFSLAQQHAEAAAACMPARAAGKRETASS
jgi:hypothetical protein